MQLLKELWTNEVDTEVRNTYEYVFDLRNRIEETCKLAQEELSRAQAKAKHHYDKRSRPRFLTVGDEALILLPTDRNKLIMQWKGPYRVLERVGINDYKIDVGNSPKVFHINLLKKYLRRSERSVCSVGISIIEAERSEDGTVDDESLIDGPRLEGSETYRDVKINPALSADKKAQVLELLEEFKDIFTDKPGCTNLIEHKIELTDSTPIRVKNYPVPYAERAEFEKEVVNMKNYDIVERTDCAIYNSPVVMVKKKDGTNRFCVNYSKINQITKFDAEPQCDADDIYAKLSKDRYFSKFDCSKGYWAIPMAEDSKVYTGFSTPTASYVFKRMPFGLVNSGACFDRLMRMLLQSESKYYVLLNVKG